MGNAGPQLDKLREPIACCRHYRFFVPGSLP